MSVVILSYNRPRHLRDALRSVSSQSLRPAEIVVVDNRSESSDKVARVVGAEPMARLVRSPRNVGFSGGMNLGVAAARYPWVYLTEDDIILDTRCLESLLAGCIRDPSIAVAAPIMMNLAAQTVRFAGGWVDRNSSFALHVSTALPEVGRELFDTWYVPGASIFASRKVLAESGPFDGRFFMYSEDVDFALRLQDRGHRMVMVRSAVVWHFEPPSTPDAPLIRYHKLKNRMALHLLHGKESALPRYIGGCVISGVRETLSGDAFGFLAALFAIWWVCLNAITLLSAGRRGIRLLRRGSLRPLCEARYGSCGCADGVESRIRA